MLCILISLYLVSSLFIYFPKMVKQVSKKSYLIKKSCVFSDMQHNKQPDIDVQRAKTPFQGWRNQGVRGGAHVSHILAD